MRTTRRRAVALATVLAAAALPLAVAPPVHAEEGCHTEDFAIPRCDDSTPPTTEITSVTPEVARGWVAATTVRITFTGAHTDADTDPIGFECQLTQSSTPTGAWTPCTSPATYTDLLENQATPYTFRVRAVDLDDAAQDVTNPLLGRVDTPDVDATPAEVTFTADATPPNTFGYLKTSYAEESGNPPMLVSTTAEIRLQSDQAAAYRCRLDGRARPCVAGITLLRDLAPGRHRFRAAAVDAAGNTDPTPYVQELFVPRDLAVGDAPRASRGDWTRHRQPGALGDDVLETRTQGALLTFPVRNVREIRLLAPGGPDLGKVEVRVGRGRWWPVSLRNAERTSLVVHDVRGEVRGLVAGLLQVRVASRDKLVRIDAVSAR